MKHTRLLTAVAAALLVLPLAACSAMTGGGSSQPDHASAGGASSEDSARDSSAVNAMAGDRAELSAESPASDSRSIIRTANLDLEVTSTADAAKEIATITAKLGGEVVSQNISSAGDSAEYGDLAIRVPTAKLDQTIAELSQVGKVRSENRSAQDVTSEHVDLKARVAALKTSVERLTKLMANAGSTTELLEAESALSQRQQELDGLSAQLKALEGQIEQADVYLTLSEPSALPGGGPQNFWDAVTAGVSGLGAFLAGALIALGVALPWLVVFGSIAAAIYFPIRARRKRRQKPRTAPIDAQTESAESVADSTTL